MSKRTTASEATAATPPLPRLAYLPTAIAAGLMLAVELVLAGRYGFHRDELYFMACARHIAWGYVDQPPLVPAVARAAVAVFGPSVFWLRVPSAVAGSATVVCSSLIARELGGARTAQLIAAVAAGTSAQCLAAFHLLSTASFDIAFWALLGWIFCRLIRTADTRLWVPAGAVTGLALLNKLNVAFLVGAFVAGLLLGRSGRLLANRWAATGAAIALAVFSPDVVWNATHHWAQLSMLQALHRENSTLAASLGFLPAQLIVVGPVLAFLWLPGLWQLLHQEAFRPMGVMFVVLAVVYTLSGAKPYYLAGGYYPLLAAGSLRMERSITSGRTRVPRVVPASVLAAVAFSPLILPVLPASALAKGPWEGKINKDLSATVGWRSAVEQIAAVADRLPADQRHSIAVFTGDYGAAGAVDLYGGSVGLPPAISGHNTYWWWGPGSADDARTTIAVNLTARYLHTIFATVTPAGSIATPGGVWTEERGAPIYVCTHQRISWAAAWPAARHYG